MSKFQGTLDQLKEIVSKSGLNGEWADSGSGKYTFKSNGGGVLNWWPSKGTLQFQGKGDRDNLADLFREGPSQPNTTVKNGGSNIFIVHGHDSDARDQLELALRRLGLDPFVLMNSSGN